MIILFKKARRFNCDQILYMSQGLIFNTKHNQIALKAQIMIIW